MYNCDATGLPFNASVLGEDFLPAVPGRKDSIEQGWWILFRDGALVLDTTVSTPLFEGERPGWAGGGEGTLIGRWRGRPVRLLEIDPAGELPEGCLAEPLLLVFFNERLANNLLTLAGLAQQVLLWQRKSGLCSLCGGETQPIPGTWGRQCRRCGGQHFPHIHPCALVLVSHGDKLLLIRKREWPPGYYSLPSGFCDFGEALEECARREVAEETGIRISNLRYVGSQSWPFPGQLMIGFTAEYDGGEIVIDHEELEDAAWFPRDDLPPTFSTQCIASWMIFNFGERTGEEAGS
jgi:NAD+ diphosphatase